MGGKGRVGEGLHDWEITSQCMLTLHFPCVSPPARPSGKLLHIDFGDCFEASMNREKFPEKVPFRLTRMMVKAMEVSGIEGNFRWVGGWVVGRVLRPEGILPAVDP